MTSRLEPGDPMSADDQLAAAVAVADLPSLLAALAHVTSNPHLPGDGLFLDPTKHHEPQGGWNLDQQARARAIALRTLHELRDGGWPVAPEPTTDGMRPIMSWMMGSDASDDYLALLLEELGGSAQDLRAPSWSVDEVAPGRAFRVAVIGAGMSGLLAAHRLRQAGVEVVVFEKNDEVGGTWLQNTYPGCRVDVASHLFCYSFAQRDDWPQHFSTQRELLDYFTSFADKFDLRSLIRFCTTVEEIRFDDESAEWRVSTVDRDGRSHTAQFDAVVNATGQLNRPKLPDIAGRDSFAGPSFHSAEWDHAVDLDGRRVAVIGTGASAAQFIPIIAARAEEVLVFQRTPNWLAPTLDYHDDVADGQRWLLGQVPYYSQWYRFWLFWRYAEGILPAVKVDPDWDGDGHAVSAANEELRTLLGMYLGLCFGDRPDLLEKVMPQYPPAAKRIIRDNGVWATTLKRDNLHLVTDPIA
ncbi:MAG TPA: NAD(P)/FAD-dependent oxidoreductase, partial [Ilumatobacteraceae bacterium]